MIFLRVEVMCRRLGDESCKDFDRESLVFVLQGFPYIDIVEQNVEEIRMFLQGRPPFPQRNRPPRFVFQRGGQGEHRSEEHTSELQSRRDLVCRLLLEKKK